VSRDLKMLRSFIKELMADREVLEKQKIVKDENGNRILYKNYGSSEIKSTIELNNQIYAINMLIMEKKAKIFCLGLEKKGFEVATIYKDYDSNTLYLRYESKMFINMIEFSAYKEEIEWRVKKSNKSEMKDLETLLEPMPKLCKQTINLKGVR
jgi:hypothetical protein